MAKPTYIVSGHPRTGTSTMMRFLLGGGLPVIADEDKKKSRAFFDSYGNFEVDNIGQYLQGTKPEDTAGRVIKVVAPYIHWLPMDRKYKIVFMLRDINEIITSLLVMRTIWKHNPADTIAAALRFLKETHLDIGTIKVQYNDMVRYPRTVASTISEHFGRYLNVEGAIAAIDPNARTARGGDPEEILRFDFDKIVPEGETR